VNNVKYWFPEKKTIFVLIFFSIPRYAFVNLFWLISLIFGLQKSKVKFVIYSFSLALVTVNDITRLSYIYIHIQGVKLYFLSTYSSSTYFLNLLLVLWAWFLIINYIFDAYASGCILYFAKNEKWVGNFECVLPYLIKIA